jgi:hypothetical protein
MTRRRNTRNMGMATNPTSRRIKGRSVPKAGSLFRSRLAARRNDENQN